MRTLQCEAAAAVAMGNLAIGDWYLAFGSWCLRLALGSGRWASGNWHWASGNGHCTTYHAGNGRSASEVVPSLEPSSESRPHPTLRSSAAFSSTSPHSTQATRSITPTWSSTPTSILRNPATSAPALNTLRTHHHSSSGRVSHCSMVRLY